MRLGMSARREIYQAHFRRCQKAGKAGKGKILDELTGTAGLNRDHLAHVPASYGKQDGVAAGRNAGVRKGRGKRSPGKRSGRLWRRCIAACARCITFRLYATFLQPV
jgi:hypothetical protein